MEMRFGVVRPTRACCRGAKKKRDRKKKSKNHTGTRALSSIRVYHGIAYDEVREMRRGAFFLGEINSPSLSPDVWNGVKQTESLPKAIGTADLGGRPSIMMDLCAKVENTSQRALVGFGSA
jgi:hypothetical protein